MRAHLLAIRLVLLTVVSAVHTPLCAQSYTKVFEDAVGRSLVDLSRALTFRDLLVVTVLEQPRAFERGEFLTAYLVDCPNGRADSIAGAVWFSSSPREPSLLEEDRSYVPGNYGEWSKFQDQQPGTKAALDAACKVKQRAPLRRAWLAISEGNNARSFISTDGFVVQGNRREFWVRTVPTKKEVMKGIDDQPLKGADGKPREIAVMDRSKPNSELRIAVNCAQEELAVLESIEVDVDEAGKEKGVRTRAGVSTAADFSAVRPGSVGSDWVAFACDRK